MKILLIDDCRIMNDATKTVRNYDDAIKALTEENWDLVYLDHDLACFGTKANGDIYETSGYTLVCWLEEHPDFLPKQIKLVSMNPVGRINMMKVLARLYKEWNF